jgi:flagellar hook-associated protein 3 FlgL
MTRVADFAQHQRNLANILNAQNRIYAGQLQISSGRKALQYSGIARDANRLVNAEMAHARTNQFIANNDKIDGRLGTMETNVSQMFDVMSSFKALLINALNANNAADLALPTQGQAMLNQITALLNVEEDGRYLFAGARTDTPPVDQTALPAGYTIPTSDGDAGGFYTGDNTLFSVRADESFDLQYGINAGEAGFERTIRALHLTITGTPNDRATMEHALAVTSQAIDDLADVRTRIGVTRATLSRVNQMHEDFLLFSEKTISDIENVDITKAITNMTADQVVVEASFLTISRLAQLTLTNFLR